MKKHPLMKIVIAAALICIFLPMLLVLIPTMGVWAIWWTTGATWMISGLTCFLRYLYWRHKAGKQIMQPA